MELQFHPGRVSCQNKFVKLVHLVGFILKKFVTMQHCHMNGKYHACLSFLSETLFARQHPGNIQIGNNVIEQEIMNIKSRIFYFFFVSFHTVVLLSLISIMTVKHNNAFFY